MHCEWNHARRMSESKIIFGYTVQKVWRCLKYFGHALPTTCWIVFISFILFYIVGWCKASLSIQRKVQRLLLPSKFNIQRSSIIKTTIGRFVCCFPLSNLFISTFQQFCSLLNEIVTSLLLYRVISATPLYLANEVMAEGNQAAFAQHRRLPSVSVNRWKTKHFCVACVGGHLRL